MVTLLHAYNQYTNVAEKSTTLIHTLMVASCEMLPTSSMW